jgi:hypothetical protein
MDSYLTRSSVMPSPTPWMRARSLSPFMDLLAREKCVLQWKSLKRYWNDLCKLQMQALFASQTHKKTDTYFIYFCIDYSYFSSMRMGSD